MGARERWVFKEGDKYIEHSENDGHQFLRHGPERHSQVLTDKETITYLEFKLWEEIRKNEKLSGG